MCVVDISFFFTSLSLCFSNLGPYYLLLLLVNNKSVITILLALSYKLLRKGLLLINSDRESKFHLLISSLKYQLFFVFEKLYLRH